VIDPRRVRRELKVNSRHLTSPPPRTAMLWS
jgi:hypothetical protein